MGLYYNNYELTALGRAVNLIFLLYFSRSLFAPNPVCRSLLGLDVKKGVYGCYRIVMMAVRLKGLGYLGSKSCFIVLWKNTEYSSC